MDALQLVGALASLVVVNLVLSGDNALVIGLAAHRLPPRQRRLAIVLGGAGAVVLRVVLTVAAALLLLVPALKLVGGVLLGWIAFRLLEQDEGAEAGAVGACSIWDAMQTIVVADLIMSLDNVLAIGAAAHGNLLLLIFGLALSMPLVLFAGGLFAELLNRFGWLVYVGAAVIAYTAGQMIAEDDLLAPYLQAVPGLDVALPLAVVLLVLPAAHWCHRRRPAHTHSA
ncbi:MAG TPA: YjbE family putative metal transport protein [Chloroflexota bacterium]